MSTAAAASSSAVVTRARGEGVNLGGFRGNVPVGGLGDEVPQKLEHLHDFFRS